MLHSLFIYPGQFGESRWTKAIFITIVLQALFAIIFESVIFAYHSNVVNIIYNERLGRPEYGSSLLVAYANARSLLVYFTLFMIAQVFTVILVLDAVNIRKREREKRQRDWNMEKR